MSTADFSETEQSVLQWAKDRSIFDQSNTTSQWCKLDEEHQELAKAILSDNRIEIIDAIGDMLVVLTLIANMINSNLSQCYNYAWNQIKDRKGKMVNGIFVKD